MLSLWLSEVRKITLVKSLLQFISAFGASLLLGSATGHALTCELLFHASQTAASDTALLQASYDRLLIEQKEVRDRIWLPSQIREIEQKGRLEFEDREKAVKYYRGLIAWKLRTIQEEITKISESQKLASYKSIWPANLKVGANDVPLFSNPRDFFKTLEMSEAVFQVSKPSVEQVAMILSVMNRIRILNRTSWANREAADAAMAESLRTVYPGSKAQQLAEIAEMLATPKTEKIVCCGRGNCEGCTHPNVIFRNKAEWPGPTYEGPSPRSTLPLYSVMDFLFTKFPRRDLGKNFWDR